jgi:hypothetical protein
MWEQNGKVCCYVTGLIVSELWYGENCFSPNSINFFKDSALKIVVNRPKFILILLHFKAFKC